MKLFDNEYFKRLVKSPRGALKEAGAVRIRADLADKTNTLLAVGLVLIVCSQALKSAMLPISIVLSLAAACLIFAAGWLQFTFNKRSKK